MTKDDKQQRAPLLISWQRGSCFNRKVYFNAIPAVYPTGGGMCMDIRLCSLCQTTRQISIAMDR